MNDSLIAPNLSERTPVLNRLALVGWATIALLSIGLFWVDVVYDYLELTIPCAGAPGVFNDSGFNPRSVIPVTIFVTFSRR